MGNIHKGQRSTVDPTTISPDEFRDYLAELKRRPGTPIPCLNEDTATVQGLIDLLIIKGIIGTEGGRGPDESIVEYAERYNSIVTGLVMLLIETGVITEKEMEAAILAFHHAIRHFGNNAVSFEKVSALRRETLKKQLEKECACQ